MGLVAGVTPLLAACTCIPWGRVLDAGKRLVAFSSVIQFLNAGLIFLMLVVKDFTLFFILNLIRNILTLPCSGMQEEYLLHLVNTKEVKYGRIRKWGTIGYAFTGLVAPVLVGSAGLDGILILGAVLALVAGGLFGTLPEIGKRSKEVQVERVEKAEDHLLGQLIRLIHNRQFLTIMILSFTVYGVLTSASNYGIQTILMDMEAPTEIISALPFITVVMEIVFLTVADRMDLRGKENRIFLLAVFLCMVRWGMMSVTDSYWVVFLLAGIHGIVCGMTLGIQTSMVGRDVEPEVRSTAFLILSVGGFHIVPAVLNLMLSFEEVNIGAVYFLISVPGAYLVIRQVIWEIQIRGAQNVKV